MGTVEKSQLRWFLLETVLLAVTEARRNLKDHGDAAHGASLSPFGTRANWISALAGVMASATIYIDSLTERLTQVSSDGRSVRLHKAGRTGRPEERGTCLAAILRV